MNCRRFSLSRLPGLVAGALLASMLAVVQVQADTLADIQKTGSLRVAVPQDFPPFGSVGPDLEPRGYDIDMARLIGQELGVPVELVPVTSTNRIPYLTTAKVDLVISSLGRNPDREKVIDFSEAYAPFFNGVFGPKDAPLSTFEELAGRTVGVTRGAVEDLELSRVAPATAIIKRFEDNNATLAAYLSGQVEFIATGNVVAASVSEQVQERPLDVKVMIQNSPCYIGIAKGEENLKARVNAIIAAAKQDGRLDAIAQRWLKAPLPEELRVVAAPSSAQQSTQAYRFDFAPVFEQSGLLLSGAAFTLTLTAVGTLFGLALGICGALCRAWRIFPFDRLFGVYVEVIRNTPFLVQLFFIFFGLPALGVKLGEWQAAVLAMVINLGAYSTEIIRAGIQATPRGQLEAAQSLALTRLQTFRHVVLRPALTKVWPALTSQVIIVMLGSAVCSQIAAEELTFAANFIQSRNFRAFETYFITAALYFVMALLVRQLLSWIGQRLIVGRAR